MFKNLRKKLGNWIKSVRKLEEEKEEKEGERRKEEKAREGRKEGRKAEREKLEKREEKESEEKEEKSKRKEKKKGFFRERVRLMSKDEFSRLFEKLEILLLENNIALTVVDRIREKLEQELVEKEYRRKEIEDIIKESLRETLEGLLVDSFDIIDKIKEKQEREPFVIVFLGVNGSGKTTTIAKIAYLLKKNNLSCVIAAADTFRAASIEQISKHAEKLNVRLVKHDYGADPAAVAFDAIKYARAHKKEVVLIDTAGRMHTKENLMMEMEKICRVSKPDLNIFVAESITGNDAVEQAKTFNEKVGIDAVILTKADVDEKGGTAISIGFVTDKPVLYLGIGQEMSDLKKFDKRDIIESMGFC